MKDIEERRAGYLLAVAKILQLPPRCLDRQAIRQIALRLKEAGIWAWFDEWEVPPGTPFQRVLESQIESIKSAAVFIGPNGIGPWQDVETMALLRQFTVRGLRVIPVLLADCTDVPKIPLFFEITPAWISATPTPTLSASSYSEFAAPAPDLLTRARGLHGE